MSKHVMIDFETLSTQPNAVVLSLGAVSFDADGFDERTFYTNIDRNSCINLGMHIDPSTVEWWQQQSKEAQMALLVQPVRPLFDAMKLFNDWVHEVNGEFLWGNGADFDNPILRTCFNKLYADIPFKPWAGRCYRTIKNIPGMPKMSKREGVHHNALDDAMSQALHLIEMNKVIAVLE